MSWVIPATICAHDRGHDRLWRSPEPLTGRPPPGASGTISEKCRTALDSVFWSRVRKVDLSCDSVYAGSKPAGHDMTIIDARAADQVLAQPHS